MMHFVIKIFVLGFIFATTAAEEDYCDERICPPETKHVACDTELTWNERCPDDAQFVEFTPKLKKIILDAHNKLRNRLALGRIDGYPPARRMATMTWDEELAELAKYNTVQCKLAEDACRSTQKFWAAGQNLAVYGDEDDTFIAGWAPGHWFEEYPECNLDNIRNFHNSKASNGQDIGHFTQVVRDDAYKIGCSISKYPDEEGAIVSLVACNYAVGNVEGYPVYDEGVPGSGCESDINPKYPGLCSIKEVYDRPYIKDTEEKDDEEK